MDKLKLHTPDFTEENIAKLAELFPGCVTEIRGNDGNLNKGIDFDLLRQELSGSIIEGSRERYHLDWPGKREALLSGNTPTTRTLRPCRDESVNFDTTKNIFIEGDNLDALKVLQESYLNKVKMIYIDPPYNTGKDFIYSDNFHIDKDEYEKESGQREADGGRLVANLESNGRFHSDWLSMMYPRLKLARNLLKDDGVIFVSIDDNEVCNLRKICDEVFGEINCLGTIANINNPKGRSDDKFIATAHEYIAVYSKNIGSAALYGFEPDEKITKRYNKSDENGARYREMDLRKTGDSDKRADRPDMFYYFYFNENKNELRISKQPSEKSGDTEIIPLKDDGTDGRWRWGYNTALEKLDTVYAKFMPTRKIWGIVEKDYLEGRPPVKSTSSWTFKDVNSERGSEQFIELGFEKEVFQRPKPIGTLKRVLEVGTIPNEKSIVLDFFAGSAGMAQAIFETVADKKRELQFIAVQLPEVCDEGSEAYKSGYTTIAEISKERIRRAAKKLKEENADNESIDQFDMGFRVLKIDSSNMNEVYYTPDKLSHGDLFSQSDNIREDRSSEDLLFHVLLDWGVDLSLSIRKEIISGKTVFFVDDDALAACFDTGINEDFVKELAIHNPLRVVFRDSGFDNDSVKINIEQIFKLMSPGTEVKVV